MPPSSMEVANECMSGGSYFVRVSARRDDLFVVSPGGSFWVNHMDKRARSPAAHSHENCSRETNQGNEQRDQPLAACGQHSQTVEHADDRVGHDVDCLINLMP